MLCSGKLYYDIVGHEAARGGAERGGRPDRAAVPVPRRRARGAARRVPAAPRGRLGAGGAAEHGRRGGRSATASRRPSERARPRASGTSADRGRRARARATRPPTSASRTGSSGRRSASPTRFAGRALLSASARGRGGRRSDARALRARDLEHASAAVQAGDGATAERRPDRVRVGWSGRACRQSKHTRTAPAGACGARATLGRGQRRSRHEDRRIDDDRDAHSREPVHGGGRRRRDAARRSRRRSRSTST